MQSSGKASHEVACGSRCWRSLTRAPVITQIETNRLSVFMPALPPSLLSFPFPSPPFPSLPLPSPPFPSLPFPSLPFPSFLPSLPPSLQTDDIKTKCATNVQQRNWGRCRQGTKDGLFLAAFCELLTASQYFGEEITNQPFNLDARLRGPLQHVLGQLHLPRSKLGIQFRGVNPRRSRRLRRQLSHGSQIKRFALSLWKANAGRVFFQPSAETPPCASPSPGLKQ